MSICSVCENVSSWLYLVSGSYPAPDINAQGVTLMQYQRPPINHFVLGLHKISNYYIRNIRIILYYISALNMYQRLIFPLSSRVLYNVTLGRVPGISCCILYSHLLLLLSSGLHYAASCWKIRHAVHIRQAHIRQAQTLSIRRIRALFISS